MSRLAKQLLYGAFYIALILTVVLGGYDLLTRDATCSDGIQNGSEEGVDCGALACGVLCPPPLLPLTTEPARIIAAGSGFDALVMLNNPNAAYGAQRIDVALTVTAADGTTSVIRDMTYVNPLQPQYLVFPLRGVTERPASVALQFDASQVQWSEVRVEGATAVSLGVRGERLDTGAERVTYTATVTNRSAFDFEKVDVVVLLYDSAGTVVGANPTVLRTLRADEQRDVSVTWPFAVPGAVRAEAFVSTNLLANDNFIRTYDPGLRQEY